MASEEVSKYFYEWSKQQIQELVELADDIKVDNLPEDGPILPKTLSTGYHGDKKVDSKILNCLRSLQYQKFKVFNDPIHGTIELHPLLVKIIDRPAFDRLKYVKQLGGVYYVYPGVMHTRFEHSIGTCYIAGEFIKMLKKKQPELQITDEEVLCVEIAALCHDLGHGPFSHMFEYGVCQKIAKDHWEHEDLSKRVFLLIWKELENDFKQYGFTDKEKLRILELIHPTKEPDEEIKEERKQRSFLYEIVANEENGIDVDKWDYFARDCHYLGIACDFDWRRLMALSRVIYIDENDTKAPHICYRDKEMKNIYEMFRTRSSLHQRAYQHKAKTAVEMMFSEAIVLASDVEIFGEGKESIRQIVDKANSDHDVKSYLLLTDSIIQQIQCSLASSDEEKRAKVLIERIAQRKIYRHVCTQYSKQSFKEAQLQADLRSQLQHENEWTEEDVDKVYVKVIRISHGSKKGNTDPIDDVYFYKKNEPWKAITKKDLESEGQTSELALPKAFAEVEVRVYVDTYEIKRPENYDYKEIETAIVKLTRSPGPQCMYCGAQGSCIV